MVAQLDHPPHQHLQEPQLSSDYLEKTKSLICALNFVSRDLPLPPDLFNTVYSIYSGPQNVDNGTLDGVTHDEDESVRVLDILFCSFGLDLSIEGVYKV